MFILKNTLKTYVANFFVANPSIKFNDERLPTALSVSRRIKLFDAKANEKKVDLPNFSMFISKTTMITRSKTNLKCECKVCEIARNQPTNFVNKPQKNPVSGKYLHSLNFFNLIIFK